MKIKTHTIIKKRIVIEVVCSKCEAPSGYRGKWALKKWLHKEWYCKTCRAAKAPKCICGHYTREHKGYRGKCRNKDCNCNAVKKKDD